MRTKLALWLPCLACIFGAATGCASREPTTRTTYVQRAERSPYAERHAEPRHQHAATPRPLRGSSEQMPPSETSTTPSPEQGLVGQTQTDVTGMTTGAPGAGAMAQQTPPAPTNLEPEACPVSLPGVSVRVSNVARGVALSFVAEQGLTDELRARVRRLADVTQSQIQGTGSISASGTSSTTGSMTGGTSSMSGTSSMGGAPPAGQAPMPGSPTTPPPSTGSAAATAPAQPAEPPAGTSGDVGELQPGQSPNRPSSTYAQGTPAQSTPVSPTPSPTPGAGISTPMQSPQSPLPAQSGMAQTQPGTSGTGTIGTGVTEDAPPANVRVAQIARGARLVLRAQSRAEVADLRRIMREHAEQMRQGVCPIIRFRQTAMTSMGTVAAPRTMLASR